MKTRRGMLAGAAMLLAAGSIAADTKTPATGPALRGVMEIAVDGIAQVYVFVFDNGDLKAVSAIECRTDQRCAALMQELKSLHDIVSLNLKSGSAI